MATIRAVSSDDAMAQARIPEGRKQFWYGRQSIQDVRVDERQFP